MGQKQGAGTEPRRCASGFTARMTAADYNHVVAHLRAHTRASPYPQGCPERSAVRSLLGGFSLHPNGPLPSRPRQRGYRPRRRSEALFGDLTLWIAEAGVTTAYEWR